MLRLAHREPRTARRVGHQPIGFALPPLRLHDRHFVARLVRIERILVAPALVLLAPDRVAELPCPRPRRIERAVGRIGKQRAGLGDRQTPHPPYPPCVGEVLLAREQALDADVDPFVVLPGFRSGRVPDEIHFRPAGKVRELSRRPVGFDGSVFGVTEQPDEQTRHETIGFPGGQ